MTSNLLKRAEKTYHERGLSTLLFRGFYLVQRQLYKMAPIDMICYRHSWKQLQECMKEEESITDIFNTVGSYKEPGEYRGWGNYETLEAIQTKEDITAIAERVQERNPKTIVELGTAKGGTLYLWSRVFSSANTIVSVDWTHQGKSKLFNRIGRESDQEIICIQGDTHNPETRNSVEDALIDKEIDFLYIDADHSYEGVKTDFEMYEPLVADDGVIGFHDIRNHDTDVPQLWDEVQAKYRTEDFGTSGLVFL